MNQLPLPVLPVWPLLVVLLLLLLLPLLPLLLIEGSFFCLAPLQIGPQGLFQPFVTVVGPVWFAFRRAGGIFAIILHGAFICHGAAGKARVEMSVFLRFYP